MIRMKSEIPDDILIAVPIADSNFKDLKDLSKVDTNLMKSLKAFLEEFKEMKMENSFDSDHAKNAVRRAIELYRRNLS